MKVWRQQINDFFPMARILIILRNPVKRAHSNYKFSVSHQLESLSFQEALMAEAVRLSDAKFITSVNPYAYERRGHYIDYIRQYAEIFSADQMKVLIFEEFVGSIQSIQSLYRWLGITEEFVPEHLNKVVNPSVVRNEDYGEVNKILAEGYQNFWDGKFRLGIITLIAYRATGLRILIVRKSTYYSALNGDSLAFKLSMYLYGAESK